MKKYFGGIRSYEVGLTKEETRLIEEKTMLAIKNGEVKIPKVCKKPKEGGR